MSAGRTCARDAKRGITATVRSVASGTRFSMAVVSQWMGRSDVKPHRESATAGSWRSQEQFVWTNALAQSVEAMAEALWPTKACASSLCGCWLLALPHAERPGRE